jgi:hypothetical protein
MSSDRVEWACAAVMWKMTAIDVESTLKDVCNTLFKDESVTEEQMKLRAAGLLRLGELFVAAANKDGGEARRAWNSVITS